MGSVLSPSWPNPADQRRTIPPRIRRRVRAAERRVLRHAVSVGAAIVSALLVADVVINLLVGEPGSVALVPFELAAAAFVGAAALFVRRGGVRAEATAVCVLLIVCATALLGMFVMPAGRVLASAQLAILLVGTGLFLPWQRRWHLAAVGGSVALTLAFVVSPLAAELSVNDRLNLATAVLMAGATSVIGQGLWQSRLRGMLEQQFELRHLNRYARRQEVHVNELNRELNRVARRDSLTGVGNRLALDEAVTRLLDQGDRLRPARFALVLFDIDHFKDYNDRYGHLAGDAALGHIGEILRRATRGNDLAFRYGGEEFLLLLPDADLNGAIAVAERVRLAAEASDGIPAFTISGGVALCDPADGRDPEPLLRRADAALYLAKRAGRNRIAADELSIAMQRQSIASA
jgi:diguanylate cyclase (GGDEF)-like protein